MIESAVIKLLKEQRFYAHLIQGMKKHIELNIPTIGVNVTDHVNLYINPFFWESLSLKEQVAILIHECKHVLNNHFYRFKELEPLVFQTTSDTKTTEELNVDQIVDKIMNDLQNRSTFKLLNQAGDYAINEDIPNLPINFKLFDNKGNVIIQPDKMLDENGKEIDNPNAKKEFLFEPCIVDIYNKKSSNKLDKNKHLEYYYKELKKNSQKGKENSKGKNSKNEADNLATIDDHSIWEKGNKDSEYTKEKIRQLVNKSLEKIKGGIGTLPSDLQLLVDALNYKPRDWRQDLQRFVVRTNNLLLESSRKKRNRRYGIQFPGDKLLEKLTLMIALDSSGSMWNEDIFGQLKAEVDRIYKQGAEIIWVTFDATINNVKEYKPNIGVEFTGGGGTLYKPVFEELKNHEVDALIVMGDMDSADFIEEKPSIPVLWARINSKSHPPAKFGKLIDIDIKKKV